MTEPEADLDLARQHLARIAERREAHRLVQEGHTAEEIAEEIGTPTARARRLVKVAERLGVEETPLEVIMRAAVDGTDRSILLERLKGWPYTFAEWAPNGEAKTRGSWDDVDQACFEGLLSISEFEEIRAAVEPPGC